jgi:dihydroorotate dehydrogenase
MIQTFVGKMPFESNEYGLRGWAVNALSRSPLLRRFTIERPAPKSPLTLWRDVQFRNPLGLAAGCDRSGAGLPIWKSLGFGFCEIGPVTIPPERSGRINPRAATRPEDMALCMERFRWQSRSEAFVAGINIGIRPDGDAGAIPHEPLRIFRRLYDAADYFVVNLGMDACLNEAASIPDDLIEGVLKEMQEWNLYLTRKPILIKIPIGLSRERFDLLLSLIHNGLADGLVIRQERADRAYSESIEVGISDWVEARRYIERIRVIRHRVPETTTLIGEGPLRSAEEWNEKKKAGLSLWQLEAMDLKRHGAVLDRFLAESATGWKAVPPPTRTAAIGGAATHTAYFEARN